MSEVDVRSRAFSRVGAVLCGKWHLEAVIGIGGMATVYAATHRNRHRVAVKMLHPELSGDLAIRARFLREGYVANTIGHAGTVRVLDDDVSEDGAAFLVMELLEGETVAERCLRNGGRLGLVESLHITDHLLSVLAVAHDLGILHRDVKPENLFITTEAALRVLDFGVARVRQVAGSTRIGSFLGTPAYSAPEQARGRWSEVDERSDLFSAGATLFTLLSGREVHEADTPSEQLALAIGAPAPSVSSVCSGLPPEVCMLVDRALAYDKADRWPSARAMQRAVRAALDALPSQPLAPAPRRDRCSVASWTVDVSADAEDKLSASCPDLHPVAILSAEPPAPPRAASAFTAALTATLMGAIVFGTWWIAEVSSHPVSERRLAPRVASGYGVASPEVLGGEAVPSVVEPTGNVRKGLDVSAVTPLPAKARVRSDGVSAGVSREAGGAATEPPPVVPQQRSASAEAEPVLVQEREEDLFGRRY